jgi:alpha-glucosidase
LGIFHPFCRVHSSGDHGEQEPWSFGEECTNVFRKFVEIRYQLLPYIYTTFYQYHKEYTPMMRPLAFVDQDDKETVFRDHEFLCGDNILVCPVLEESARTKRVYLPGSEWYHMFTNKKYVGKKEYDINSPLDEMPIFIKAGAIIPKYPIQQYVGEKVIDTITLDVYFKEGEETSYFYDDDKNGYGYEKGEYHYSKFLFSGSSNKIEISQSREGSFESELKLFAMNLIGQPSDIESINVDGEQVKVGASVPSGFSKIEITLK